MKADIYCYKIGLGAFLREVNTKTKVSKVVYWKEVKQPQGSQYVLI